MKNIINRLSFIRYLYDFAIQQSYKPYPNSIVSLLLFHDSIEHFNIYALEYKVDIKKEINFIDNNPPSFLRYFDILDLTQKNSMQRLNEARRNLKHKGNWPSKIDIESFRASVTNFFEENTRLIFDLEFSDISLIDLISNEEVRTLIKESKALLIEENGNEALIKISLAFAKLFGGVNLKISEKLPSMRLSDFGIKNVRDTQKVDSFLNKLKKSIESITDAMKCNVLGIDYQRYVKFRKIAPHIAFSISGKPHIYLDRINTSLDEIKYCIDFVIESALSIQDYINK